MLSSSDFDVTEAISFFNKHSVEVTFLVPTQTGLKKNILDATAPVRNYLKQKGVMDILWAYIISTTSINISLLHYTFVNKCELIFLYFIAIK